MTTAVRRLLGTISTLALIVIAPGATGATGATGAPQAGLVPVATASGGDLENFVTRVDNKLMDGDQEFHFLSVATPTLALVEDNYSSPGADDFEWRFPDAFEIRDQLETIRRMGGQATRIYDISVRNPADDPSLPRLIVDVPRKPDGSLNEAAFNEEGFRALDQVLATANELGIRIFIPITNQFPWHGGIAALSALRGIDPGSRQVNFYTSDVLQEDYKAIVDYITQRTNTITGVQYKDDPTIAAWVFGNEISNATNDWLTEMAAHFKDVAPNQLTMQHNYSNSQLAYLLAEPNIDIIATSSYDNYSGSSPATVRSRARAIVPTKPYIQFEFGFAATDTIEQITNILIEEGAVGGQLWGLRPHNRDGGFYWHGDEFGGSYIVRSYHFPGFPTGDRYDETNVMDLILRKAYEIRGLPVPPTEPPGKPTMLPIEHVSEISWQGSAGAESYVIERATSPRGRWTVLVDGITDDVAHTPIFNDRTAQLGETYRYRVTAQNEGGRSRPSHPSAPVKVESLAVTDDLVDFSQTTAHSDGLMIDDGNNRPLLERLSRAVRSPGPPPAFPIVFDFEGDAPTAGWSLPDWMAQNDLASSLRAVEDGSVSGDHNLAMPVTFAAGGGGQAGPEYRWADAPVDLRGRDTVTMSVYAPVEGLAANLVFNGPWNPSVERPLNVGWNELTLDISADSPDFASVPESSTSWLVRIASTPLAAPFQGDVLVDDIAWTSSTYVPPEPGEAPPPEQITWHVDGNMRSIHLEAFFQDEIEHFQISTSSDGVTFQPFDAAETVYGTDDATYGYWNQVLYDGAVTPDVRYLRVEFPDLTPSQTPQLDRTELVYVPYSTTSLKELVDHYRATGQISRNVASQLKNTLSSAERQIDKGHNRQAIDDLERFIRRAGDTRQVGNGNISPEARDLLVHDAQALIDSLR